MNDPHVVSLHYKVIAGPDVIFDAHPLDYSTSDFDVHIEHNNAVFTLREHCATADEARQIVEPFVEAWEIDSGLAGTPGEFRLEYDRPEIIDRSPSGSVTGVEAHLHAGSLVGASSVIKRGQYPRPPEGIAYSPLVGAMYYQYAHYKQGKMTLAAAAYFCADLLTKFGGAEHFCISKNVLSTVTQLATTKGGLEARKADGFGSEDFSAEDRRFLETAMNKMIRRAGEREASPNEQLPQINLADLK
jgi:hypothetical protein